MTEDSISTGDQVSQRGNGDDLGQEPNASTSPAKGQEPERESVLSPEALDKELREARKEAARYRTEVQKLREMAERSKGSEEELEKLQDRLSSLEAALSERDTILLERSLDAKVARFCAENGIGDVEVVQALIRLPDYYSKLEFEEDGGLKNADEVLKGIMSSKPYLQSAVASFSPTNPAQRTVKLDRESLSDHDFYRKHEEEILRAIGINKK